MKPEQAKRLEVFLKKAESTNARIAYDTEKYRKVFLEYKKIHDALAPIYDAR